MSVRVSVFPVLVPSTTMENPFPFGSSHSSEGHQNGLSHYIHLWRALSPCTVQKLARLVERARARGAAAVTARYDRDLSQPTARFVWFGRTVIPTGGETGIDVTAGSGFPGE